MGVMRDWPGISMVLVCGALSTAAAPDGMNYALRSKLGENFKSKCKVSEKFCPETFSGSNRRFPVEDFSFSLATRGKV